MLQLIPCAGRRAYPPRVSAFTQPFWQALSDLRFISTQCRQCQRMTFPPKIQCPDCWSDEMAWTEMPRFGRLYSWTRVHAAPAAFQGEAPYVVGIVDLDDRVRLGCRIVVAEGTDPRIGAEVEMVCLAFTDGPMFAATLPHAALPSRPLGA